jgi:hypothetical protein
MMCVTDSLAATLCALELTSNFLITRKYLLYTTVIDLLYSVITESNFPMKKLKSRCINISFLFSIFLYKDKQGFYFSFLCNCVVELVIKYPHVSRHDFVL